MGSCSSTGRGRWCWGPMTPADSEPHPDPPSDADLTVDAVCRGQVTVVQPRRGYRFSIDSLLLADLVTAGPVDAAPPRPGPLRVVDLGAGCGVIGLLVAHRRPAAQVTLVELQPEMAGLASRGVELSNLQGRVTVLPADLRQLGKGPDGHPQLDGASVDLVVSNPPYEPRGRGTENPQPGRATARHQRHCAIDELMAAARRLLRPAGLLAVVYPAADLPGLLQAAAAEKLGAERLRPVASRAGEPANRVLLVLRKGGRRPLVLDAPLVLYGPDGGYSPDARRALGEA